MPNSRSSGQPPSEHSLPGKGPSLLDPRLLVELVGVLVVLILGSAIGQLGFWEILVGAVLVVTLSCFSTYFAVRLWKRELQSSIEAGISEAMEPVRRNLAAVTQTRDELHLLTESLRAAAQGSDGAAKLAAESLGDSDIFERERRPDLVEVVICKRDMGTEFEDRLEEKASIFDFAGLVLENVRRDKPVRYIWISLDSAVAAERSNLLAKALSGHEDSFRVLMVSPDKWERLPTDQETIYYRYDSGVLEAFTLAADGAPEHRRWLEVPKHRRAEWRQRVDRVLIEA